MLQKLDVIEKKNTSQLSVCAVILVRIVMELSNFILAQSHKYKK
jgi:hypothetical protein